MWLRGEQRHFSSDEVGSEFFVMMWIKWLPDYLVGHVDKTPIRWFRDDPGLFSPRQVIRLVDNTRREIHPGGFKGTTVICDFSAMKGASLYDIGWTSKTELEACLLTYTKLIVAHPESYSMPGWLSMSHAFEFLKLVAAPDNEHASHVRQFLDSAGMLL